MSSIPFTSWVKLQLNRVLNPMGLEIGTTLAARREAERVEVLDGRGHWIQPKYDQGLDLDGEKSLRFLRDTCLPYRQDFMAFPRTKDADGDGFYVDNGWYGPIDGELLYSFVRKHKPKHVVEIGSGFSTRLMRRAIKDENLATIITSVDPEPRVSIDNFATEFLQSRVEYLDKSQIVDSLDEGDLLFIDSSHFVVSGGDVPFLFLEVLPRLRKGVWIHIHDIFLPFDYPKIWVQEDFRVAEQHLVHAFLSYNEKFEIVWPARYMWEYHRPEVLTVIPTHNVEMYPPPSSLWLRRIA